MSWSNFKSKKIKTSISEIGTFMRCPLKHYFRYGMMLEPRRTSPALNRGKFFHKLLELHYKSIGKNLLKPKKLIASDREPSLLDKVKNIKQAFKEYEKLVCQDNESNLKEELDTVKKVWNSYLTFSKEHDRNWKTLMTEYKFHLEIPGTDFIISGQVDLIVEIKKQIWVVEHKTGVQETRSQIMLIDPQLSAYVYAVYKEFGKYPQGVITNFICTVPPSQPKILKDGTISRDKACNTDKTTYIEALKKNKQKPINYADIIAKLPESVTVKRFPANQTKDQLINFVQEIESALKAKQEFSGKYRNPTKDCTWDCPYFTLCTLHYAGYKIENFIDDDFIRGKK